MEREPTPTCAYRFFAKLTPPDKQIVSRTVNHEERVPVESGSTNPHPSILPLELFYLSPTSCPDFIVLIFLKKKIFSAILPGAPRHIHFSHTIDR
jgi:hypothetical protein